jgi:hypothetical protein
LNIDGFGRLIVCINLGSQRKPKVNADSGRDVALIRMRVALFIIALVTAVSSAHAEPDSLLDGKLKFDSRRK